MTPRLRLTAVLCALGIAVISCGNRIPHEQVVAEARARRAAVNSGSNPSTAGAGNPAVNPEQPGPAFTPEGGGPQPQTSGPTTAPVISPGQPQGGAPRGGKSPIVIGTIGSYSGIPGGVLAHGLRGMQAWAASVNAKGGIGGHPIKLVVADDRGDPTQHQAALQNLVERQHVIAVVGMFSIVDRAGANYMERKRVPVVGGIVDPVWFTSPMYFAHVGASPDVLFGNFKTAARYSGAKNGLATLTCVEAEPCAEFKRDARPMACGAGESVPCPHAGSSGLRLVYQADVSLAQPDFTAECLQAQNSGAQVVLPVGDTNLVLRVASSCARQGYHPLFITVAYAQSMAKVQNLDGTVAVGGWFPFVGVKGSITDEYTRAMKTYFPNVELAAVTPGGWSAGKLFEKAATIALARTDQLKSNDILEALWTMRGERLGGWIVPVTYRKNKPAIVAPCWVTQRIQNGTWVNPDGTKLFCRT